MHRLLYPALVGACIAAASVPARASIILTLDGAPTAVAGGFDYTYSATLSSDEQLNPKTNATFFTLYDFGAATLVSDKLINSADWSFLLNTNITTYAQAVQPNNIASIFDVRGTYTGPTVTGLGTGGLPMDLGTFTLFTKATGPYAIFTNNQDAQLDKYAPGSPTNDTIASNIDAAAVPTLGRPIPEPASLALIASGLAGLAFTRRRKQAF